MRHENHNRPPGKRAMWSGRNRDEAGMGGQRRGHGRRGGGRPFDHGGLRWALLSLISEKPSHGYELIRTIEDRLGGAYAPSPGVVYPNLTLLEEMGALEAATEGGKTLYSITDAGRALLADNAEAVASAQERMARFSSRAQRPEQVREAIMGLRAMVNTRLTGEPPLTSDQIEAVATILKDAAERVARL